MRKLFFKTKNIKRDSRIIASLANECPKGSLLLVNLSQENRDLEIELGIENLIIYNSYDYFKGVADFEKTIYEIDEYLHILPSTVKKEKLIIDLDKLYADIDGLEDYNYNTIFFVYEEDQLSPDNFIIITDNQVEADSNVFPNRTILLNKAAAKNQANVLALLDFELELKDLAKEFYENLEKGTFVDTKPKNFFGKIKGLFGK